MGAGNRTVARLFWSSFGLWGALFAALIVDMVAGDDTTPIAFVVIEMPILGSLALVLGVGGTRATWTGGAPKWLATLILTGEVVLVCSSGPVWERLGKDAVLQAVRADLEPTIRAYEEGRSPPSGYGRPEVLERGPPLRIRFSHVGWHSLAYDAADRPFPGCLRLERCWYACPFAG